MHTPKMSIAMATPVLALFAALSMGAVAVKRGARNCSAGCGYYDIPYPFGLGTECSLPGFNLSCEDVANNPYLILGNPSNSITLDSITSLHAVSVFPTVSRVTIAYSEKIRDYYSVRWTAPGRPFAISGSSNMSLVVAGCSIKASLFIGDSDVEVGNCSVVCVEDDIMERLPPGPCIGIGCCLIDIKVNLRAFTLNISRTGRASGLLEQVNAFITYQSNVDFIRPSELLIGSEDFTAKLTWAIPYPPDCKRAMEDRANYACVSNHSYCVESPIGGYVCGCSQGFHGNPYIFKGCTANEVSSDQGTKVPVYDTMQPKANCPTSCGNISLPFPFGSEVGCFARLQLYLTCNPGLTPPILQMSDGSGVTGISTDEGVLRVLNPTYLRGSGSLYGFSGEWGVVRWAVDNTTCKNAMALKEGYRCFSHSECLDVTDERTLNHVGYRCKCSQGFEGNPYIKDGCTIIISGKLQRGSKLVILGVTIGLSSGGGILFLVAIFVVLTRRWKRRVQKRLRRRYFRKNKGILLEQLIFSDQSANDGTKIFSLEELEKATNNFDYARVVGSGGHGTVYKGILTDQRVVAIKRSKLEANTEIEQFINEVSILSQINHRNVVKLHGCCLEAEVPLFVYEFISNGTLYDLLHHEQNGIMLPLPWEERLRIATEIAGALMYLHSAASVSILHRDVKCMNVLLNESYTTKVSDFGASRSIPINETHLVTGVQGTFGYLDPEYYHTGQLNEKSDVYSFGVILLELLTRKKPIFENENGEKQNLSNYFLCAIDERPLEEVVDEQILWDASVEAILSTVRLAQKCLSPTRGERPTMKDVEMGLQMLRGHNTVAPGTMRGEEMTHARRESAKVNVISGVIPMPAGRNVSRQYSLEQEFVSSARVPW